MNNSVDKATDQLCLRFFYEKFYEHFLRYNE